MHGVFPRTLQHGEPQKGQWGNEIPTLSSAQVQASVYTFFVVQENTEAE